MENIKYQYYFKVYENAKFLSAGYMTDIEKCAQMIMTSKAFSEYAECFNNLSQLIYDFASTESALSGGNYVIVSKINPAFGGRVDENETWDKTTMVKLYVANADIMKKAKQVVYCAIGEIRLDASSIVNDYLPQ